MTPQEADKIIAEFMGHDYERWLKDSKGPYWDGFQQHGLSLKLFYSQSLDALVPAREKLYPTYENWVILDRLAMRMENVGKNNYTIQQAAAIATAKAILEVVSE